MTLPLRITVAVISGENTRLACWRARPRDCELLLELRAMEHNDAEGKPVSA